jgi:hypothetical protein
MSKAVSKAVLIAAAALAGSCGDVPLTAPAGSTVSLIANPPFIVANGGVSVVTAVVIEPVGTFVPDGTEVFFFTDLGTIEGSRQTKDGVARVNFVAGTLSGTATISAISGGAATGGDGATGSGTGSASVTVAIGSSRPSTVLVTADPPGMRSNSASRLQANVFDDNGNPVSSVPVIFSISGGTAQTPAGVGEYLESGGSQLFTDTNGQVFDTLRSRRPLSESALVTVTATTPTGLTGSVTVAVN